MLTHEELLENYRIDNQANTQSLLEYKEARRYYHGSQLPEDILEKLNLRGQPPIVENIYKMIVNKILGYKIQSLQEIKVSGRQEEDKPLANILNDLLKVFSQQQNYDKQIIARDRELIFGMAVLETWVEIDSEGDKHVELKSIAPDCFLVDAYSKDSNALDSRRFHRRIDLDKEQATELFGENVYVENHTLHDSRTTVIESWYCEERASTWREQKWARYFWHEQGGIYQYEQTPCATGGHPFIIAKYQIDERNRWYGLFRDIKPLQDFINFAENRAVNMLGSFKALFEDDAVLDTEEFIDSVGLDNAVIKVRSGALKENKIQFIKHNAEIQALSQKTEHKRHLAKILSGLNDEALGMAANRQSGVAIAQRREAGLLGLQDFIKAGDDMDRLLFEKVLSLMIAYFSNEQVFKIVDSKNKERYFSINTNEENKLRAGKFDLIFKTTLKQEGREERFTHWAEIFKIIGSTRGDLAPALLPLVLKDVDSPIVAELQDLLEQKDEEARAAQEAQAPLQETQQQLALAEAQAKIAELEAKANKYNAQAKTQESITENLAAEQASQPQANPSDLPQTPTKSTGDQESPAQKQAFKAMQINPKKAIYDQR